MIVILSESHDRATNWLRRARPRVNPFGKEVLVLTHARESWKAKGLRVEPTKDELIWESNPKGTFGELVKLFDDLHAAGFPAPLIKAP